MAQPPHPRNTGNDTGHVTGHTAGDDTSHNPGHATGDDTSHNPGHATGDDTSHNPGHTTGDNPSHATGHTIGHNPSQITLWCTFYHQLLNDQLLAQYRNLMTAPELAQAARFYFERDRRRYIVTRALVRSVLSHYAEDVPPKDWRFENNPYGRPHIVNDSASARSLSFNITHTDGLIVLAVAREHTLGVDAENTESRPVSTSLADSFFAPEEAAALRTVDAADWQQRFFEYWTLKESYIKARGMGLSIPLDKFSFSFPAHDDVELYVHPEQQDPAARWRFWQFTLAPSYTVALCVERQSGEAPSLTVKDAVPLVSETDLNYSLVRASR